MRLVCCSKAICCSLWQVVCICTAVLDPSELNRHMLSQLSKDCSTKLLTVMHSVRAEEPQSEAGLPQQSNMLLIMGGTVHLHCCA